MNKQYLLILNTHLGMILPKTAAGVPDWMAVGIDPAEMSKHGRQGHVANGQYAQYLPLMAEPNQRALDMVESVNNNADLNDNASVVGQAEYDAGAADIAATRAAAKAALS